MNANDLLSIQATELEPVSLEEALRQFGWRQSPDGSAFHLRTKRGAARLQSLEDFSGWRRLRLSGPMVGSPTSRNLLEANARLPLAAKFVALREGVACCLDVPEQMLEHSSLDQADGGLPSADPHRGWAAGVSQFVRGSTAPPAAHAPPADIIDALAQCGWSSSLDDGQMNVHVHLPGVYRRVRLETRSASFRVAAELLETRSLSQHSRRAIRRLASEADRRLPLVRFSASPRQSVLEAEVVIHVALIPGAWLYSALEMVETAIALTALEFEALRDPELAQLFLDAPTC